MYFRHSRAFCDALFIFSIIAWSKAHTKCYFYCIIAFASKDPQPSILTFKSRIWSSLKKTELKLLYNLEATLLSVVNYPRSSCSWFIDHLCVNQFVRNDNQFVRKLYKIQFYCYIYQELPKKFKKCTTLIYCIIQWNLVWKNLKYISNCKKICFADTQENKIQYISLLTFIKTIYKKITLRDHLKRR